jgi:SH3 domain protein
LTLVWSSPSSAARRYVTDSFEITLRTGPSTNNRVVAMLTSGEPVNVLERAEGWSRVQVLGGKNEGKTGWVLQRFLISRLPYDRQVATLQEKNEELQRRYETLEEDCGAATQRIEDLRSRLEEVTLKYQEVMESYEKLKRESSTYLELKEDYRRTAAELAETREKLDRLAREHEDLKFSRRIKWFMVGALVILIGWAIGLVMGRSQRKKKAPLYR